MKSDSTNSSDFTIGIDLGDRQSHICVLSGAGKKVAENKVATSKHALAKGLGKYEGAVVVLEVGTHSPWVSRFLMSRGYDVVVANPRKVRLIAAGGRKNDRLDAENLARLGRADIELLSPVQHRGEQAQRDLALLKVREGLVRERASLIKRARGISKSLGGRLRSCSTESFVKHMSKLEPEKRFPGFESVLASLEVINEQIAELDGQIRRISEEKYPETALLRQVPGVGPITALAYVLTIENPERFAKSRDVGPYVGLVPRQRDSGNIRPELGITKRGDEMLRRLLVQGAQHILRQRGKDTDLRRFGMRLVERGGKAVKKRAVVAVARKVAVLLHRLWASGEEYVPLGYGMQAA